MRQVINGKRYDTETAELLTSETNGRDRSDFQWCYNALYRTRNGSYFLHYRGGAMTEFSVMASGGSMVEGEKISPLDPDMARAHLERDSNDATALAALEKYFSESIVDA